MILMAFLFSSQAIGYENKYYKFKAPKGWKEMKDFFGMDVVMTGPPSKGRTQPTTLFLKTLNQKVKQSEALNQLLSKIKETRSLSRNFAITDQGKMDVSGENCYFVKAQYFDNNVNKMVYSLYALIPNKDVYHFFMFEEDKIVYGDNLAIVEDSLRKMILK